MKRIPKYLLVLLFIFSSCKKEERIEQYNCIEMFEDSSWITEDFKIEYTIQFPNGYEGTGITGWEGNVFHKNRLDNKIRLDYSFCGPLFCFDFGEPLAVPIPTQIISLDNNHNEQILNTKKEYCVNGNVEGIFYCNTDVHSMGKYYMKQGSEYLDGLTVYFDNSEYAEVESIIKTITKK